ncbi:ribonuclease HI [Flavobacteriaceae bacterium]|jgi:ribonuclease HI|nr:ribonuclease HI [Flavobacteriaceae bacterium]
MKANSVYLYTDGSSLGNPGPGGYGLILDWVGKSYKKEFSQGFLRTTNNRMELLAVIVGLEKLKKESMEVVVYSDSKYVVDAVEKKWVFKWEKTNYKDKKNSDLWKRFLIVYRKHKVHFQWIKGHNQHPQNERCDVLAVNAAKGKNLIPDTAFEKIEQSQTK